MPISSSKITTYITTIEAYFDYWRDLIEEVESHFPDKERSIYGNAVTTKLKSLLGVKSAKKGDAHYYAKANEAIPYDKKCSEKLYDTQIPDNVGVLGSTHFLNTLTKENEQSVQYNVESTHDSLNALTRLNVMIAEERPVLDVIIILHAYLRSVNEDSYEYLLSDQQLETELDIVTAKLELLAKERALSDAKITQQLENWRQNIDFEQNHNNIFTAKVQKLEATTTILTKEKNEIASDMKEVITALTSIQDELSRFSAFIEQNAGVMDTVKDAVGVSDPNSRGVSYTSRNQIAADPRYKQEATQAINLLAGNNKDAYASISRLTESLAEKQNNSIQGAIQASEDVVRSASTTSKLAKDKSLATLRAGGLFHTTMKNEKKALYVGDEAIFTIVAEKLLPKILPGFIGYSYDPDDKTSKDKLDKSMAKRENAADWRTKIMSVSIKNTNKQYYARAFCNTALALTALYAVAVTTLHIYSAKYTVAPWLEYGLLTQPTGQLILALVLISSLLMLMTSHYYKTKMQASQKQFLQECGIQERPNGWLKSRLKWLCSGWQWRFRTQVAPNPVPAAKLSISQRLCSWISPCNRYQPPTEELDETLDGTNTAPATNV